MDTSSLVVDKAQQLAAAGRHAEVVSYLGARKGTELADSPSLALLYGTAQARLGRHEEGLRWVDLALDQARKRDEQAVELHARNARGAIALVTGRIDEAADYLTRALMAASRDPGVLDGGRAEADQAVAAADAAGDQTLWALALRGRAEIRVVSGELELARRELDQVREMRRRLANPVAEAEDLRAAASLLLAEGDVAAAERTLREVIARAESHGRPQLLAEATRDLVVVLRRTGRTAEAQAAARTARALFTRLGAEGEIRGLAGQGWDEGFAAELRGSLAPLHVAQELADAGHYAELLRYLGERSESELEQSPMLTLLCGIAHCRLGRLKMAQHWAMVAQLRARAQKDRTLEVRALNVCGAIALERGGIDDATYFFTRAQEEATEDNDMATAGRCANNLGIIANMQGDYRRAIGAYTRAIDAYQKVGYDRGIVESQHNLAITYREQGQLDHAMYAANEALGAAERLGDRGLRAQALAGLAEIQVARGEADLAIQDAERALAVHRELQDDVLETEDQRILAVAVGLAGKTREAEALLREVIDRATKHERPLLVANAQRDLANMLALAGDGAGAKQVAQAARATFERLGARVEIDCWTAEAAPQAM